MLFNNRKQYEWRIFLSVLTFYSLTILYKLTNPSFEINVGLRGYITIAYITLSCISIIFFSLMHRANNKNKSFAHNAEHTMQSLINEEEIQKLDLFQDNYNKAGTCFCRSFFNSIRTGKGGYWDVIIKSIVIILFAVASRIVLFS